jgi:hypothetical protein
MKSVIILFSLFLSTAQAKSLEWGSDLRLRQEFIDQQFKQTRKRQRMRARLFVKGQVNEKVSAKLQLASGNTDPVSTNQSFDGGASTKDIGIDQAYLQWKFAKNMKFIGGKMKNPNFTPNKSQLLWDSDLRPEGLAIKSKFTFGKNHTLKAVAGQFWMEERSSDKDSMLNSAQVGLKSKFHGKLDSSVFLGGGLHEFTRTKDRAALGDDTSGAGNSMNGSNYLYGYSMIHWFVVVKAHAFSLPWSLQFDSVTNDKADHYNNGYMAGLSVGKTKAKGQFKLGYRFKELQKDAVVGAFTDSDFIGGGTGGRGHKFSAAYAIDKNLVLAATHFCNTLADANKTSYKRTMIDLKVKW